jgi:hypothetical protein
MSRRDYVAEILEKKGRQSGGTQRWGQLAPRLAGVVAIPDQLRGVMLFDDRAEEELYRHVPIGLVACMEGFFRLVYADLVDHGPPFRDNAAKLPNVTFSLETALTIQRQSVSIGEFVAHLLPISSLEDINRSVSTLIGSDFLKRFKQVRAAQPRQLTLFPDLDADSDAEILRAASRTFELRHIFCHELAPLLQVERGEIAAIADHIVEFLWISELLVCECLGQRPPRRETRLLTLWE